jgi:hypothetical protein
MSVYLAPSLLADRFDSNFNIGNPPSVSYLYSSNRQSYLFTDPQMDQFSFIPAIELKDKKLVFTINKKLAVYYDNTFFFSLPELVKKVQLPHSLNQELLDKIAIIANYLAQGEEYEYVTGTAKEKDSMLNFLVKKGENRCRVTVPSYRENAEITYEKIDKE